MPFLSHRVVRSSGTDVDLAITGVFGVDEVSRFDIIADPSDYPEAKYLKLSALFHSIQEGLTLLLFWEGEKENTLILPLEGRGVLDLGRFGGLENPKEGMTGRVLVQCVRFKPGEKNFALSLEFSKQRS